MVANNMSEIRTKPRDAELIAAERLALKRLQEEFPAYEVTVNQWGAAELRKLTPEELGKKQRLQQMARRAEVLEIFDAA